MNKTLRLVRTAGAYFTPTKRVRRQATVGTLLLVFLLGTITPTASAMLAVEQAQEAAQAQSRPQSIPASDKNSKTKDHIKQYDEKQMTKSMKQDYAGALPSAPSAFKVPETKVAPQFNALATPTDSEEKPLTVNELIKRSKQPEDPRKRVELLDERSATKQVFRNSNGTYTEKHYMTPQFYKENGQWKKPDLTLIEDKNAGDSGNIFGRMYGEAQSAFKSEQAFKVSRNNWQVRFAPSDFPGGMVRLEKDGEQIGFGPAGAKRVAPVISEHNGKQVVYYYDLWPGVNVRYTVHATVVKEDIILKDAGAATDFSFDMIGAALKGSNKVNEGYALDGAFKDFRVSPVSLILQKSGYITDPVFKQEYTDGKLHISVQKAYIEGLPKEEFPVVVDPTYGRHLSAPEQNYVSINSNGGSCGYAQSCPMYAGSVNNGGWESWRTFLRAPYDPIANSDVVDATLYLNRINGTTANKTFRVWHASCTTSYYCINTGISGGWDLIGDPWGALDATHIYKTLVSGNDMGGWIALQGEESANYSLKGFDPYASYVDFQVSRRPTIPQPDLPSTDPNTEQTIVTTQPILGVTTSTDADGDEVKYIFQLSSTNGVVLYETVAQEANRITIPEGLLQDGGSYVWKHSVTDGWWWSGWQNGGKFRVDLRTGKDKTSTYETVGPISASLNTGNVYTTVDSHSMKALDGSIGLSLNYNSPLASRMGLSAEYYADYNWGGSPALRRTEATIDNNWNNGSPAENIFPTNQKDNWSAKYIGYFVAPQTGSYTFGGTNDDVMATTVNNVQVYNSGGCHTNVAPCWGSSISLSAGQTVPILVEYKENTGPAYVQLRLKIDGGAQQIVPTEWLRTAPMTTEQNSGLMGHYYADDGSHNPVNLTQKLMTRLDPSVNFKWGDTAPIPNMQNDNLYVRWTGYFVPPQTGNYTFGSYGDDGSRITINNTQVLNNWTAGAHGNLWASSAVAMSAGVPVPITVEYFEANQGAYMQLLAMGPGYPSTGGPVESQHLSPGGKFLPNGWSLSADADGNLAFERLEVRQNGDVIMYDADGSGKLFTNTGTGFKPPVNEEATLIRNADSTYTLTDIDGRIYVFDVDGTLRETAAPTDDRKPAAIKYNYATQNGMPKLTELIDGVTSTRKGQLYYQGDTQCASPLSGYSAPPTANLCAFITTDGDRTDFFYNSGGRLALVVTPGSVHYSFGYDSNGMLTSIRDSLANDAIAAGVRSNDASTTTELTYDNLARVTTVKAPAPTAGATRTEYTFDYLPNKSKLHVTGSSEPNGYQQYIEYDNLLRTTKDCDVAALCSTAEWHAAKDLSLATTDAAGLKSTTLYDTDDKPTHQYGPAPTAWYDTVAPNERKPLNTYVNQMPHTETKYDEGMVGAAVTWQDYKRSGAEAGVLFGAPKLRTTGITPSTPGLLTRDMTTPPITMTSGLQGTGFSATGKLRLPAGTYRFDADAADGVRIWVDDAVVLDAWADASQRTVTGSSTFTVTTDQVKRFRMDAYRRTGVAGALSATLTQIGGFAATNNLTSYLAPNYALTTSSKVYDATLGNSSSTTNYGTLPEYGLAQSSNIDPAGLNLTTSSTYETPGATNSFMRQTAKYLPGANTAVASTATQYAHYTATDTKDNPCTTGTTEAYKQAGFMKLKTEPDPDGTGTKTPRTTETIYDDTGRVVATRYNADSWTCTTYDTRGRATQTAIPSYGGEPARTVTNNYAVGGNPLQTSSTDANGTIVTTVNLLGQTVDYADVYGNWTGYEYNALGQNTRKYGDMGEEIFYYDNLNRLSQHLFDEVVYATVLYDAFSRVDYINYNNANALKLDYTYDDLGRESVNTYTLGNGTTTVAETVTRTQSNQITGTSVVSGASTLNTSYAYDDADRLTGATIGANTYSYGFGTQNTTTCGTGIGTNANSGKNSNRTTQTINGATTNFCYDYADRLTASSNTSYNTPVYDTHGNMTKIGTNTTPLYMYYDASDRSSGYEQLNAAGTGTGLYYDRDVQGRIIGRYKSTITTYNYVGSGDWFYSFTGTGDAPDFVRNANWDITEKNLSLPGGVMLTVKPQEAVTNNKKQYSLPNMHGDTLLLTNAVGTNTSNGTGPASSFAYDPFGQAITGSVLPANTGGASYGWVGQHQKFTEIALALAPISMGARIYLPGIGRFTQVDPVEGGVENNYAYTPDPINEFDLNGQFGAPGWMVKAGRWAGKNSDSIGMALTVVGAGACIVATAGACAGVLAATAVAGGIATTAGSKTKGSSWKKAIGAGGLSTAVDMVGGRGVKAVRWFGKGRSYKSVGNALSKSAGRDRLGSLLKGAVKGYGGNYGSQWLYNNIQYKKKTPPRRVDYGPRA